MTLKHVVTEYAHTALQSPKVALSVSGGGIATGSATWLEWLPQYIGICASSVAILVSLAILYNAIVGGILKRKLDKEEYHVAKLQKEQLTNELDEIRGKNEFRK